MRNQFGYAGCIIEGALRDTDDLKKMGFQAYSRSIHPEYVFGIMEGVSFNQPVNVGGVVISAGDIIVGDNDGVVAIPHADLQRVLRAANEILEQEKQILREIDEGTPYLDVLRRHQPESFQGEDRAASPIRHQVLECASLLAPCACSLRIAYWTDEAAARRPSGPCRSRPRDRRRR